MATSDCKSWSFVPVLCVFGMVVLLAVSGGSTATAVLCISVYMFYRAILNDNFYFILFNFIVIKLNLSHRPVINQVPGYHTRKQDYLCHLPLITAVPGPALFSLCMAVYYEPLQLSQKDLSKDYKQDDKMLMYSLLKQPADNILHFL